MFLSENHKIKTNCLVQSFVFAVVILFNGINVMASPATITFQARIVKPDGTNLESANVFFRFYYIYPKPASGPDSQCVIYVEDISGVDMTGSKGMVNLQMGSGTRTFGSGNLKAVFDNSTVSYACQASGTYSPSSNDTRRVIVQFDDGTGAQTLPPSDLSAVPYAMQSYNTQRLGNNLASDFLKFTDFTGSCPAGQFLTYDAAAVSPTPKFSCATPAGSGSGTVTSVLAGTGPILIGGTATDPTVSIPLATNTVSGYLSSADRSTFNTSATLTQAATSANTASAIVRRDGSGNILVNTLSSTNVSTRNILVNDVSNNPITIVAAASVTPYTLTLPATVGSNGQVLSTNATGDLSWINPSIGSVTNVTASVPLSSTGGATPNISIAQANTTTSGYLSNTDWNTFNNKLSNFSTMTSTDITGKLGYVPVNPSTAVTSVAGRTGVVTLSSSDVSGLGNSAGLNVGTTTGTVAAGDDARFADQRTPLDNSVTSAKILDGTITSADISAGAITFDKINQSGAGVGQVIKWDGSAWVVSGDNSNGGTVTSVSGNGPISVATGTTTPSISIAKSDATTDGYLSSSDFTMFNSKVSATYANIISALGFTPLSPATNLSGDISGAYNNITVDKIKNKSVTLTSIAANDILQYNGTDFVNRNIPTCGANQYLTFNGTSYSCAADVGASGNVASFNSRTGAVTLTSSDVTSALSYAPANSSDLSSYVKKSGDTMTGSLNLPSNGLAVGTNQLVISGGNVGIGTTSPSFKLELSGASSSDQKLGINSTQVIYLPDQTNFTGSLFVGNGGGSISHTLFGEAVSLTSLGIGTLNSNTTGNQNTALGTNALNLNTTGTSNTATGALALANNTTGNANAAYGAESLRYNTLGSQNTAVGFFSLTNNTTGINNVAIGEESLRFNSTGFNNVAVGQGAAIWTTTSINNVAIGTSALSYNRAKSESTAIGHNSMVNADNTTSSSTSYNTALGAYSLQGSGTPANNTGIKNTAIGHSSLIGMTSGSNNIGLGWSSGSLITTGSNNVVIGSNTGTSIATTSNNILIADGAGNERLRVNSSGQVGIGTSSPSYALQVSGDISVSGNFKVNGVDIASGTVSSVSGTAPISVATGTSTPVISIAQANTTTSGYLSSTDWNTFNNKLSNFSSMTSVDVTTAVGHGFGSASILNSSDVVLVSNMPANCSAGQTLTFSSPAGSWLCSSIVMGNNTVTSAMISSVDWSKVANTPTTAAGYGIAKSTAGVDGYLSSSDFTTFNNKQSALGYTPLNPANNLSDVVSVATSRSNLGLGTGNSPTFTGLTLSGLGSASLIKTSAGVISSATSADITGLLGFAPVNKAGDTMSGTLNLPANGLAVGTNQLIVSGGNVGIGTASPTGVFEVQGGNAALNTVGTNIILNGQTGGASAGMMGAQGGSIVLTPGAGGAGSMMSGSAGFISLNGRVGVGTTTPNASAQLTVSGGDIILDSQRGISSVNAAGNSGINLLFTNNTDQIIIGGASNTNGVSIVSGGGYSSPSLYVAPAASGVVSGNVGIGTSSPSYKLHVAGDVNVTGNFKINGTNISNTNGTVTNVTGTLPVSVATGTTTPVISMARSTASVDGYLASSDFTTFNNKQASSSELTAIAALGAGPGFIRKTATNTYSMIASIDVTSQITGAVPATNGGTGQSSFTIGDLLYASSTTALSKLAASTSGYVLTSNGAGTAPSWQAAGGVTFPLLAPNGTSAAPSYSFSGYTNQGLYTDAFGRLAVASQGNGVLSFSGGAALFLVGSAATPSMTEASVQNTGIFWPTTTSVGFSTGASERMRITSAGNVGIGTTSPSAKLDVTGGDGLINSLIVGRGGGNSTSNVAFGLSALTVNSGSQNTAIGSSALVANTAGGNNTAIGYRSLLTNATGNDNTSVGMNSLGQAVGDNNTSMGSYTAYDVTTGTNNTFVGYNTGRGIVGGSNNTILGSSVQGLAAGLSNTVIIADGSGNQRIRVDSTGNVGIGTTSPAAKLDITNSTPNTFTITGNTTATSGSNYAGTFNATGSGALQNVALTATASGASAMNVGLYLNSITAASTNYAIYSSATAQSYLAGNVGIGTTTPNANTLLDVNGTARVLASVESAVAETNSTATYSVPDTTRNVRRLTLNANTTITLPVVGSAIPADGTYTLTLRLKQDGTGSRTVTWAAGSGQTIKWDGGAAPTIAAGAAQDTIVQFTFIGGETVWYASMVWREN